MPGALSCGRPPRGPHRPPERALRAPADLLAVAARDRRGATQHLEQRRTWRSHAGRRLRSCDDGPCVRRTAMLVLDHELAGFGGPVAATSGPARVLDDVDQVVVPFDARRRGGDRAWR